jgi:hypothetical protein
MQVTSKISVVFPKLGWGINAGDTRELPEDKDARAIILAHPDIEEVKPKKENREVINDFSRTSKWQKLEERR